MKDWMDHLNYLEKVALADVAHLKMKEATYQGSWKRSGGRSAWFMLRRKIDRMLEMLKKPEDPHGFSLADLDDAIAGELEKDVTLAAEIAQHLRNVYTSEDVFLKIEEDPSGEDGSVLAEVRDLRRYLLLVEAEMVSRGVVDYPNQAVPKGGGMAQGGLLSNRQRQPTYCETGACDPVQERWGPGTPEDLPQSNRSLECKTIVEIKEITEKDIIYRQMTLEDAEAMGYTNYTVLGKFPSGHSVSSSSPYPVGPGTPEDGGHQERLVPRGAADSSKIHIQGAGSLVASGGGGQGGRETPNFEEELHRRAQEAGFIREPYRPGTPEDGGHHERQEPDFLEDEKRRNQVREMYDDMYRRKP